MDLAAVALPWVLGSVGSSCPSLPFDRFRRSGGGVCGRFGGQVFCCEQLRWHVNRWPIPSFRPLIGTPLVPFGAPESIVDYLAEALKVLNQRADIDAPPDRGR